MRRAVETDFVAESSAEQVTRRGFENAAGQVPKSDLNAAGRRDRNAGLRPGPGTQHEHFRIKLVDVQRILADDVLRELV